MKYSPDRTLSPAERAIAAGQGLYNAFKSELFQLSAHSDELSFAVSEVAHADDDEVDQCPYAASSASEELDNAGSGLAYIESMKSEPSAEKTEQQCHHPVLTAPSSICTCSLSRLSHSATAFYADNGLVVQFCSTIPAIHTQLF